MNLLNYCRVNNYCCATCFQSYKKYINENNYNLYCGCGGKRVNEKSVCINYESKLKIEKEDKYD